MLQIAIDHGDIGRAGSEHPFDRRAGKPTPPDPQNTPHTAIHHAKRLRGIGCSIGRIIIHENDFPRDARKSRIQQSHHRGNIVMLVESRHDNRKLDRLRTITRLRMPVHKRFPSSPRP